MVMTNNTLRIVLLGQKAAGKSALCVKFIDPASQLNDLPPTAAANFFSVAIKNNNTDYKLSIWDTSGDEKFRSLLPNYISKKHAVVICVKTDSTDIVKQIEHYKKLATEHKGPKFLVFTQSDQLKDAASFETEQNFSKLKQDYGFNDVFITSAEENINLKDTFDAIVTQTLASIPTEKREMGIGYQRAMQYLTDQIIRLPEKDYKKQSEHEKSKRQQLVYLKSNLTSNLQHILAKIEKVAKQHRYKKTDIQYWLRFNLFHKPRSYFEFKRAFKTDLADIKKQAAEVKAQFRFVKK